MNLNSILDKIVEKGRLVLTQPTMLFVKKETIKVQDNHVVVDYEVGRPDLICLKHYKSAAYVDYLLKFNGISDPFSINEGDVLKIPVIGEFYKKLERPKGEEFNIVRQEFIGKKRVTPKDQRRADFLKKKYKLKEVLPPNVVKTGHKTYKFTEKNGEKATELGMGPATPDKTYFKKKSTIKPKTGSNETSKKTEKPLKENKVKKENKNLENNLTEKGMERKHLEKKKKSAEENRSINKENRKGRS